MANPRSPKVTVGLPVYNGEKYIPRAIECWLDQNFDDFELLVSDNGSTDDTREICKDYRSKDARVRYVRYPNNMGRGRSFGRLAECARGEYFVYGFHNDYFAPAYLGSCLDVLEHDQSVVLCYSGTYLMGDDWQPIADVTDTFSLVQDDVVERYEQLLANLELANCFHGLIRTSALLSILPFNICAAGDVCFLSKLILEGKFHRIDAPLCWREKPAHQKFSDSADRFMYFDKVEIPHQPYKDFNSLPFIDLIMLLVDHVCCSTFSDATKEELIKKTYNVLFNRYRLNVLWELDNLIRYVQDGNVRHLWKGSSLSSTVSKQFPTLNQAYLMKRLQELDSLISIFANHADLYYATACLLSSLGRLEEAELRSEISLRIDAGHSRAARLLTSIRAAKAVEQSS